MATYELDVWTFVNYEFEDESEIPDIIANALMCYREHAGERGLELKSQPFASLQPNLFEPNMLDVTVRAVVAPTKAARKPRAKQPTKRAR